MERQQFVGSETDTWWMWDSTVDQRVDELRRKVGSSLGALDASWYVDQTKRDELYSVIAQRAFSLFDELDLGSDDDKRVRWLESVVATTSAPGSAPDADRPGSMGSRVAGSPQTPAVTAEPVNTEPPRRSAFKSKTMSVDAPVDAAEPVPVEPAGRSVFKSKSMSTEDAHKLFMQWVAETHPLTSGDALMQEFKAVNKAAATVLLELAGTFPQVTGEAADD
jgi:hypothetical protein